MMDRPRTDALFRTPIATAVDGVIVGSADTNVRLHLALDPGRVWGLGSPFANPLLKLIVVAFGLRPTRMAESSFVFSCP